MVKIAENKEKTQILTQDQAKAAVLFAEGLGVSDIATELGIDRVTLWRWRKLQIFNAEISKLASTLSNTREQGVTEDVESIRCLVLDTLIDVAQNDSSGSARVQAARTLGEYMERAELRAQRSESDLMEDQSGEIRKILSKIMLSNNNK